mmetsp:Transcript_22238/g.56535  ORF Transcript_22238/g.56535 Transcript_22238/m.56535 type:complete len:581 (-) Transcript_22238:457-2199(-)
MAAPGTTHGPYLRLTSYKPDSNELRLSVLVVVKLGEGQSPPQLTLHWRDVGAAEASSTSPAIHLDTWGGWAFMRLNMGPLVCGAAERKVEYAVASAGAEPAYSARQQVAVAAAGAAWRWGFYSCNGFHAKKDEEKFKGIAPLWRDVMREHAKAPLHAIVGGGDQLYCDPVWKLPALVEWTSGENGLDHNERLLADVDPEVVTAIDEYYLGAYIKHWSSPVWSDALAAVPHIMSWDDHDIFDGWGSYPDSMQKSPMFQAVYAGARRAYALFQHHTTWERATSDNDCFGPPGTMSLCVCLGPHTAIVMPDTRAERSRKHILSKAAHEALAARLAALPPNITHLVVCAPVPMVYPEIPASESIFRFLTNTSTSTVAQTLQKTGMAAALYSQFGTGELYDDILDHWGASVHVSEKERLLTSLAGFAAQRKVRVTSVSGDVHVAGVGFFRSSQPTPKEADPRYIAQVISSAIGNTPPPPAIVKLLKASAEDRPVGKDFVEGMDASVLGGSPLVDKRNWCLVEGGAAPGAPLAFTLRLEVSVGDDQGNTQAYKLEVPALGSAGAAQTSKPAPLAAGGGCGRGVLGC